MKTTKIGIKHKSQRILKLEHDVARLKTDVQIMEYQINDLKETLKDIVGQPMPAVPYHRHDDYWQPLAPWQTPIVSNTEGPVTATYETQELKVVDNCCEQSVQAEPGTTTTIFSNFYYD